MFSGSNTYYKSDVEVDANLWLLLKQSDAGNIVSVL